MALDPTTFVAPGMPNVFTPEARTWMATVVPGSYQYNGLPPMQRAWIDAYHGAGAGPPPGPPPFLPPGTVFPPDYTTTVPPGWVPDMNPAHGTPVAPAPTAPPVPVPVPVPPTDASHVVVTNNHPNDVPYVTSAAQPTGPFGPPGGIDFGGYYGHGGNTGAHIAESNLGFHAPVHPAAAYARRRLRYV